MNVRAALLAASFLTIAQPALAQEEEADDQILVSALRNASVSITGSAKPLLEYPQSVRVIDSEAIARIGADRLDEVIDLAGGVARQNNFGGLWDKYSIRGFAGDENTGPDILINRFGSNLGFNAPIDTATVERFEFLKGAAAALSGRGEPGGSLNIVTKAPQDEAHAAASLSYGSWDSLRLTGDVGGPLTNALSVRLIGVVEDRESFRDTVASNRELIAPSISFTPSDSIRLLYQAEYMRNRATFDRGIVGIGGDALAMDIRTFLGEPGDGRIAQEILWQQGTVYAAMSDRVALELGFSHRDGNLEGFATMVDFGGRGLQADGRTAGRQRRFTQYAWDDLSLRVELTAQANLFGFEHDLRFGVDRVRHGMDAVLQRARGSVATPILLIDVFNPVYGQPLPATLPNTDREISFRSESVYAQDLISLGDVTILLGTRWNSFEERNVNNLANGALLVTEDSGITPRAAITWAVSPSFSLYSSWGESLRLNPTDGTSVFDAERSESSEIGLKYQMFGGILQGQAVLFSMTKRNVLNPNAVDPFLKTQIGRQRSRGLETELTANLDGLFLTAVYTYIDATVRRDQSAILLGTNLSNVPEHSGAIYASKSFGPITVGGGLTHVGKRVGEPFGGGYMLPGYTTVRADITFDINDNFSLRADVDNIFDQEYIANSYANVWTMPGAPRNFRITLSGRY